MSRGFRVVARSHDGVVRDHNEDAGFVSSRLLIVADGMGGHAAGEVASAAVVHTLASALPELPNTVEQAQRWLLESVNEAHGVVGDLVAEQPDRRGMGTTASLLVLCDDGLLIGHIGDSRIYRLRDGEFKLLTVDHTYVQSLVAAGELTEEEAEQHPRRNLLMRAIDGIHPIEVDLLRLDWRPGDRFLLCSDGLSGVLPESAIANEVAQAESTLAVSQLIEYTLAAGAPDNVTVLLAECEEEAPQFTSFFIGCAVAAPVNAEVRVRRRRRRWPWIVLPAVLLLGSLAGLGLWLQNQWYVCNAHGHVAIYRGIPGALGPIPLNQTYEIKSTLVTDLTTADQLRVWETIPADSLADAEAIVQELVHDAYCAQSPAGCANT